MTLLSMKDKQLRLMSTMWNDKYLQNLNKYIKKKNTCHCQLSGAKSSIWKLHIKRCCQMLLNSIYIIYKSVLCIQKKDNCSSRLRVAMVGRDRMQLNVNDWRLDQQMDQWMDLWTDGPRIGFNVAVETFQQYTNKGG